MQLYYNPKTEQFSDSFPLLLDVRDVGGEERKTFAYRDTWNTWMSRFDPDAQAAKWGFIPVHESAPVYDNSPLTGPRERVVDVESGTYHWYVGDVPWEQAIDKVQKANLDRQRYQAKAIETHRLRLDYGFEFEGNRYSATQEDLQGLQSIRDHLDLIRKAESPETAEQEIANYSTPFSWSNGEWLDVTAANVDSLILHVLDTRKESFKARREALLAAENA